jgi:hypothetical protein
MPALSVRFGTDSAMTPSLLGTIRQPLKSLAGRNGVQFSDIPLSGTTDEIATKSPKLV